MSGSSRIHYVIVDDEAPGRTNLRLALQAHADWVLVAECDSTEAARTVLADRDIDVDVIFLDIQMPAESGLALARDVSRRHEPPLIVFVTAYSVHAVEAFDVHALDYLLKPLDDGRLAQAVERSAAMLRHRQRAAYGVALRDYVDAAPSRRMERISVRSAGRIEQIRISDIHWIASAGNYVELHLAAGSVLHRMTLNQLEALLAPEEFLRVHRRAIVRRDQIVSLSSSGDGSWHLTLGCGAMVAVSERYLSIVKAAM